MVSPYSHIQYTPKVAACHEVLVMFFVHFSVTLTLSRGLRPMTFALYRPANKESSGHRRSGATFYLLCIRDG